MTPLVGIAGVRGTLEGGGERKDFTGIHDH